MLLFVVASCFGRFTCCVYGLEFHRIATIPVVNVLTLFGINPTPLVITRTPFGIDPTLFGIGATPFWRRFDICRRWATMVVFGEWYFFPGGGWLLSTYG